MASTYSQRLYLAHSVGSDTFSVPDDETWIIRTVTIFYPGAVGGGTAQLTDAGTDAVLLWDQTDVVIRGSFTMMQDFRIVLPPGSSYRVDGGGNPDIGLFGYALSPS